MRTIDWQRNLKDAMWAMFWMRENAGDGDKEADKEALKENIARLIRMTTQKTAGQRGLKNDIDWNSLEHTLMGIACAATALALEGEFGEMPETIEEVETDE